MHHLFSLVLNVKDLSKAGDLFSLPDSEIQNDASEILTKIKEITSSGFYIHNENDQSVVEICIARVTAFLRDSDCIENHVAAIVELLKTCLNHDLKPLEKDIDPPHAKIASDVLACVFLNYTKRNVMKKCLPTSVKFLHKGNPELSRNISSYLPLAAIEHPDLLAEHVFPIIDSIIGGNYGLARILPQIYYLDPDRINEHVMALANLLNSCEDAEKSSLLSLFKLVASNDPFSAAQLLEPSLTQLLECLKSQTTIVPTLEVLYEMSEFSKLVQDHLSKIQVNVTSGPGSLIPNASVVASELYSRIGCNFKEKSSIALSYMIQLLQGNSTEHAVQTQILREIVSLMSTGHSRNLNVETVSTIRKSLAPAVYAKNSVGKVLLDQLFDLANRKQNVTVVNISQSQHSQNSIIESNAEISVKSPVYASSSSYSSLNMNPNTGLNLASTKSFIPESVKSRISGKMNGTLNSTPSKSIHQFSIPNSNMNSSPICVPTQTHLFQQHRPTITRINVPLNPLMNRRRSPGTMYNIAQNRSYSSSTSGLKEDIHPNSTIGSHLLASQSSGGVTQGNMNGLVGLYLGTGGVSTGDHSVQNTVTNPSNHHVHISHALSLATSGNLNLSSSASILNSGLSTNLSGQNRMLSASYLLSNGTQVNPLNSSSKGLPSPTQRLPLASSYGSRLSSPPHQSQPDLRNSNNNTIISPTTASNNQNNVNGIGLSLSTNNQNSPTNHNRILNNNNLICTPNATPNDSLVHDEMTKADNYRISVFEPYPMRDTVQHFCEKHLDKIKGYVEKVCVKIPLPVKCTIEERKSKKNVKLHFACQSHTENCIYLNRLFTMKTKYPRVWIHLMFLALQSRSQTALSTRESSVSSLKNCWDILKAENKSFLTLVTSAFPSSKDQDQLLLELQNVGFFDLFEFNAIKSIWGCFFCNYPKRAMEIMSSKTPILEGCLQEKKGKWRLFKRWKTKYFTLSGGQLQAKGNDSMSTLHLHQILSMRVTRSQRNIPKAFEIFTEDKSVVLKPKNGKNANEWVQCLSVLVAKKDLNNSHGSSYPFGQGNLRKGFSISGLRTAV